MKNTFLVYPIFALFFLFGLSSCSEKEPKQEQNANKQEEAYEQKKPPLEDLAKELIEAIKTKDAEKYYQLFPPAEKVAKYGIMTYGLRGNEEEMALWRQPWPRFSKTIDSLEQKAKPQSIKQIENMFKEMHNNVDWTNMVIDKLDTLNSRAGVIGDVQERKRVTTLTTQMKLYLSSGQKKYSLNCQDVIYIEHERWYLRAAFTTQQLDRAE